MEISNFKDVVESYDAIFLDAYGVLKNSQGIIPGMQTTIDHLLTSGKPFYILTNDASRSPRQMVLRYQEQGLEGIETHHIISSGMMAYAYLKDTVTSGLVAYLGTKSSADYIKLEHGKMVSIMKVHSSEISDITAVAFFDDEGFDWQIAVNKTINILRQLTVPVVVANSDITYPVAKNEIALATGGIAAIIEQVSGKKFIHFGKPDGPMFYHAYQLLQDRGLNIPKNKILMVGDTLDTDILGGNKFGLHTMLTLSGNTSARKAAQKIQSKGIIPNYVVESIGMEGNL
ncbi:MAG: HAD-IIA family hydrolase [Saprospiraceae bacterium]